jgi:hypothetical protein
MSTRKRTKRNAGKPASFDLLSQPSDATERSESAGTSEHRSGGGGDGKASGAAAAAVASSRLDIEGLNGTSQKTTYAGETLVILGCRCKSWVCARCGPGYWSSVGQIVRPHLGMFKRAKLLTLTIDRKLFESGKDAYDHIQGQGLIRRFLRLLGFRKGLCVLAFHPSAPDWPHWHVLVDLDDLGKWVDLERMWELWREKWGCGGLDLSIKNDDRTAEQAARYALSYCQHQSGVMGEWVRKSHRAPRAYETYGELRDAICKARKTPIPRPVSIDEPQAPAKPTKARATSRTVADRMTDCGIGSAVMLRRDYGGGSVTYRYLGTLSVSPGRLALASQFGELHRVDVRHESRELCNGTQVLDVFVPVLNRDPKELFNALRDQSATLRSDDDLERNTRDNAEPWPDADDASDSLSGDESGDDVAPF